MVCKQLGSAEAKHIRLTVTGERVCINGVRAFLYEMLYNLCDSAIKYDVPDGHERFAVFNSKPL